MEQENAIQPNSVTYWESRQINIGDYENISFGGTSITKVIGINREEKKVEISNAETTLCYPHMSQEQAMKDAQRRVREVLDAREKEIRMASNSNGNTPFDTLKKAVDFGVVTEKEIGITDVKVDEDFSPTKVNKKLAAELDEDFDDFDDKPKPVKTKSSGIDFKKLSEKQAKESETQRKSKFQSKSTSGLFSKSEDPKQDKKPPVIDLDEEIPY